MFAAKQVFLVKVRSVNKNVFIQVNDLQQLEDFIRSGPCVKLLSTGCEYSDQERPFGGKALKPDERGINFCNSKYSTLDNIREWQKYHDLLKRLFVN